MQCKGALGSGGALPPLERVEAWIGEQGSNVRC
jgi:hypothetical protein